MRKSFTLIELLVVATIIALLATAAFVSYSQFSKQARDARRKTDLEQIRSALELYRSNVGDYPASLTFGSALTDGTNTYLQKVPNDPMYATYNYVYTYSSGSYSLDAHMEAQTGANCGASTCGTGISCNYCMGPYGQTN